MYLREGRTITCGIFGDLSVLIKTGKNAGLYFLSFIHYRQIITKNDIIDGDQLVNRDELGTIASRDADEFVQSVEGKGLSTNDYSDADNYVLLTHRVQILVTKIYLILL